MFELQTNFKQILKLFNPRTQPFQNIVAFLQDLYYLEFLRQCNDTEITPNSAWKNKLFGYNKACIATPSIQNLNTFA